MASEINYRDAVLERSDLALFAPPHWLNDRALHFAMKLLEDDSTTGWLLLDPAVYAFLMLQCDFDDADEVSDLRRGLVFPGSERVLVTVVSDAKMFVFDSSCSIGSAVCPTSSSDSTNNIEPKTFSCNSVSQGARVLQMDSNMIDVVSELSHVQPV